MRALLGLPMMGYALGAHSPGLNDVIRAITKSLKELYSVGEVSALGTRRTSRAIRGPLGRALRGALGDGGGALQVLGVRGGYTGFHAGAAAPMDLTVDGVATIQHHGCTWHNGLPSRRSARIHLSSAL